jgi:heme-degrading monooxygenase HmoA
MTRAHQGQARIDPARGGVSFIQVWDMPTEHDVDGWLSTMHERIHLLTGRPGFRSMSLHRGLDGAHAAVYAQWDSLHHLEAGRNGSAAFPRVCAGAGVGPPGPGLTANRLTPCTADQVQGASAIPAGTGSGDAMPVRSRCGTASGSGSETALAFGAGFGLRGWRSPAPPPRPR